MKGQSLHKEVKYNLVATSSNVVKRSKYDMATTKTLSMDEKSMMI
jgi:hypothetical protein